MEQAYNLQIIWSKLTRALFVVLSVALSACGSSSSSSNSSDPFVTPGDSAALTSLLTTRFASDNDFDVWLCRNANGVPAFAYQLTVQLNGIEYHLLDNNQAFPFTWQATSVDSIAVVATATGVQSLISNIVFTSQNSMSFATSQNGNFQCQRSRNDVLTMPQPTMPVADPGSNSLSYGGQNYQLTHGFEEQFRYRPVQGNDTHRNREFNVANGEFFSTLIMGSLVEALVWRPRNASVWLRANLYTPGPDDLTSATFTYVDNDIDEDGAQVAGLTFFKKGRFGVDLNNDGNIVSDDGEFLDVVGGSMTVSRAGEITNFAFELSLENGVDVFGAFQGDFITVP